MARRPRIALVSREVWPFVTGGGIGRHVSELATTLAEVADVVVVTGNPGEDQLVRRDADGISADGVRYAWVAEPVGDLAPVMSSHHAWALAARDVVLGLVRDEGPFDLIEAEDFRGVGAAIIEARRAGAPELAPTQVAVRLHSTWEMIAALDGQPRDHLSARIIMALERSCLRFADVLLAPTAATLRAYSRYYSGEALAPAHVARPALVLPAVGENAMTPSSDSPLQIIQVGRLQRFKGSLELARALVEEPDLDVRLTFVGADTATGPLGGSMWHQVRATLAEDRRARLLNPVQPDEVLRLIDEHDVVVAASHFEAFGYVSREALSRNRPVLASPAGGMADGFTPGRTGWLLDGTTVADVRAGLRDLAARAEEVRALIRSGAPRAALEQWVAQDDVVTAYLRLVGPRPMPPTPPREIGGRVVGIIDANRPGDVAATARALARQGRPVEVLLVTTTPGELPASALEDVHRLLVVPPGSLPRHRGRVEALEAARAAGADLVILLDAGEVPDPGFLVRCERALQTTPEAAYATAPGRGRSPRNAPLGNASASFVGDLEPAGTALVLRMAALPLLLPEPPADGAEDLCLAEALAARGRFGTVVPEPLVGRVRNRWRDPLAGGRATAMAASPTRLWAED